MPLRSAVPADKRNHRLRSIDHLLDKQKEATRSIMRHPSSTRRKWKLLFQTNTQTHTHTHTYTHFSIYIYSIRVCINTADQGPKTEDPWWSILSVIPWVTTAPWIQVHHPTSLYHDDLWSLITDQKKTFHFSPRQNQNQYVNLGYAEKWSPEK